MADIGAEFLFQVIAERAEMPKAAFFAWVCKSKKYNQLAWN